MNQLIKVTHPNESESSYLYNKQGNVISYTSPDAGTVICEYTPQGQLLRRTDANGRVTEYGYDGVRLVSIKYPDMPSDSVTYIYGDSTATNKSRGRLIEVRDASGTEGYTYGIMGEVIKTERTINIDTLSHTVHSYEYEAEYDSWGRVRTMTYPDGEMVTYNYYNTGELRSVIGKTEKGTEDKYLDRAGYDPYGRTIYRKLGNGTENFYTYDNNERLESSTLKNDGNIISTNTYRYDATDNITGIRGISESAYNQEYNYDDLNRLISAGGMATEGKSEDGSEFNAYTMNMDYNQMSSPLNYELAIMNPTGTKLTNFAYLYGTDIQPNAPIKVGDMTYTYDASGNPITIDGEEVGRSMTYDSDNRLREIMDYRKNIMSRYTYNHTGERAVKRYGAFESMAVNGAPAGSKLDANAKYSAYVSPYYVENGSGTKSGAFSKHYYAGSDRIASKTADDAYFYFTDHLGSTTHITDRSGDVAQYAAYTPYGSLFREYRSVQPYKFNGKELDQETGYYYYGARYYDPNTALWLGTDPLKHKYPDIGAYVYCAGNPVRYVDPDGRDVKPAGTAELIMIQNTLPKEARDYVRLDKNGLIDRKLLNSYGGKSSNFNNLKTMVNSDRIVEVVLDDKFTFMGQDGKLGTETMSYNAFDPKYDSESDKDLTGETMGGLSTGESGFMGKALFPDKDGIQNSPNGNIIVIVNKNLSPLGAAENYSHEANGHALLYILNGSDHKGASHQPINGKWIEGNKTLMEMIINSKKETIQNMQGQ